MSKKLRLGDVLVERKIVTSEQIESALTNKNEGEKLGETLIRLNYCTENQILSALEVTLNTQRIGLRTLKFSEEALKLVTEDFCKDNNIIPVKIEDEILYYATSNPLDDNIRQGIEGITQYKASPMLASKKAIKDVIKKHYGFSKALSKLGLDHQQDTQVMFKSLLDTDENMPIVQIVNIILASAVNKGASDIHIDPLDEQIVVRYRVDGTLINVETFPINLHSQIINRIKVMAKMNITEKRVPQDGRITETVLDKMLDLRISTLPTVRGEKVVMRILDLSNEFVGLENLHLSEKDLHSVSRLLTKTQGIILVSGPTGSGKTSTLYTFLHELNSTDVNIITIEDPVEIRMEGINQVQVKNDIEFTFASALRSILRQDPNIIMVGEIRDRETASIAVRASLTGHLVLSTIHTNSTVKTISRLVDMGVEPFLLASSLSGVIAQRLVRKACPYCSEEVQPDMSQKVLFDRYNVKVDTIMKPKGCEDCNDTGFLGREAIFEILEVNEEMVKMIANGSTIYDIEEYAITRGLTKLLPAGLQKVADGVTTIEEVLKVVNT